LSETSTIANPPAPAGSGAATPAPGKPSHVYLIDGSGFIFRAYHALPWLNRSDGTPTNAVYGFVNMLLKLVQESDADAIAVVFDASGVTFRNRIYDAYKAHRPEPPDDLVPQFKLVREATEAFNICQIEATDYEADDLIATYARLFKEQGTRVTIVSSDKDLMQLVDDQVGMLDTIKTPAKVIGAAEVKEKFGVGPDKVIDVQALCGDSVDNVPGVPGIGVKTAAELINQWGTLENLLEHAAEIKQPKRRQSLIDFAEQARLSKRLVTLDLDVPLPCPLEALALKPADPQKLIDFLKRQEFRKIVDRIQSRRVQVPGTRETGDDGSAPLAVAVQKDFADRTYTLVQTVEELDRWIAAAHEGGFVAIEAMTRAPEETLAELVGIALALGPGKACYVPLGHRAPGAQGSLDFAPAEGPEQIPLDQAVPRLKALLEDPAVLKIGHNVKYPIHVLARYGIAMAPTDCTMLLSYVLDGVQHGHALDELASLNLGHEMAKFRDVCGSGKTLIGFAEADLDKALGYAAELVDVMIRLHPVFKRRLIAEHMAGFYETVERPLSAVVAEMERAGVKVDRTELSRLSEDFAGRMAALEREAYTLAGHEFNIGSPKQIGDVLFGELGLEGGRKGKTGAYGTDAAILEQLALTHDLPRRILDWRQLSKLKSTYADALVGEIKAETGRVHTCFQLAATSTGRLSSTEPNVQNIPIRTEEGRKIRRAFVAEPGHLLLSADYSQIELRLAADMAGIDALKEAFQKGVDIHALTASQVFGVPVEGMDPNIRRRAKAINFGIIYGISAFGLATQLAVAQAEAADYIKAYFARFPGIRDYMEKTKAECRERGYVETLFGRKCYIPGIRDANVARRQGAERQAINAPLQGTAADIIKRAMIRLPAALKAAGLKARMLLQVHDELLFEVPEAEAEATAALVKTVMEAAPAPRAKLSVPLVVETGWATNWDEAH
jgi:DNA polymerase-1